ncbi:MAG: lipopolysaccharide/colanic/teichoic acid biosynthesis glycosyltransferase [Salibacteraceae bacterium]|jgi:lipopolysaccharide/colanic/teichoic acid biosynthesis glycosyltransferase
MIRLFEFFASLIGLLLLSPIILVITIIGLIETGSPFFVQKRVGKNQKVFQLIKFRSMKKSTANLPTHLVTSDLITKTGKFLRKTKLDELPQLINVLLGSMSLVGPRPCLPTQDELIAERQKRNLFSIRPGITGIAQINDVDMSEPKRLSRYDAIYLKKFSMELYIYCIFATLTGKGQGDVVK